MAFKNIEVLLTANAGNLRSVLASSAGQVRAFETQVKSSGREAEAAGAKLKQAAAGGALALAAGLAYAVKSAADFDASMRNVNSLTGLGTKAFQAQEQQVLAMSRRLPQSAKQLADGLYQIASSGFTGQKGLTVLNSAATAASAGLTDTGTAAEAIIGVMHSYGKGVGDAKNISDSLFQTVNLGVLSFEDLAQGMGQVVGVASAAHVSIAEVGAAVATMTRAGVRPAEAFTSLNQLITRILKPTDALAGVYQQLGYQSGEAALRQKHLSGVMEDLRRVTGGSAGQLVNLLGDVRAARGAFALTSQDGRLFDQMLKGMGKSAGETGRVLAEQSKSASYQFKLLRNNATDAAIEVGQALLPTLVKAAKGIDGLIVGAQHGSSALAPLGHAVAAVATELEHLGAGVAHDLAPLAKLALGATVEALTLTAQGIEHVTRFAADNKRAIELLGAAYAGLQLARAARGFSDLSLGFRTAGKGVQLLTVPLQAARVQMALATAQGITGSARLAAGIEGAFGKPGLFGNVSKWASGVMQAEGAMGKARVAAGGLGTKLVALGPGLAVGAVLAAGAAWLVYKHDLDQAIDSAESASRKRLGEANLFDPASAARTIDSLRQMRNETEKSAASGSLWSKVTGLMTQADAFLTNNMKEAAGTAGVYQQAIEDAQKAALAYALAANQGSQATDLSTAAFGRLANQADVSEALVKAASGIYHGQAQAAYLAAAGVTSTAQAQFKLNEAVEKQKATNQDATPAAEALKTGVQQLGDASLDAATKAKSLDDALKGLLSPEVDLTTAFASWQKAMQDLGGAADGVHAKINSATGGIDAATPAGAKLLGAWNDAVTGMQKSLSGLADAGRPVSAMQGVVRKTIAGLADAATRAHLTQGQFQELLKTYHLTPREINTLVNTFVQQADEHIKHHKKQLDDLPKTKSTKVDAPGTDAARLKFINLTRAANDLPPLKHLPVDTPGAITSRRQLEAVLHATGVLPKNKHLPVDTPGAITSRKQLEAVLHAAGVLPKNKHIPTSIPGGVLSKQQLKDVLKAADALPKSKSINVNTPGADAATGKVKTLHQALSAVATSFNISVDALGKWTASTSGMGGGPAGPGGGARGGVLPGYTPGSDIHHFVSPTGGRLDLSGGEGVLVPEAVKGLGGPGFVYGANEHFSKRRGGPMLGHPHAFANGGVLDAHFNATNLGAISTGATGLRDKLAAHMAAQWKSYTDQLMSSAGGGAGGAASWAPVVAQVFKMLGQPLSLVPAWLGLINAESSGNALAVNRSDRNWAAGTPSVGGNQVIGPTFAANAGPFAGLGPFLYGVSVNRLANTYAAVHYALGNYGAIMNVPGIASVASGGGYRPYATGGIRTPRQATIAGDGADLVQWAEPGTGGEAYIPLAPSRRGRSMQVLASVADAFGLRLQKMALGGWRGAQAGYRGIMDARGPRYSLGTLAADQTISGVESAYQSQDNSAARATLAAAEANLKAAKGAEKRAAAERAVAKAQAEVKKTTPAPLNWLAYEKGLQGTVNLTTRYSKELAKIASVAGPQVADQLAQMGDAGVSLVHRMAQGTKNEIGALAQSFMRLATNAGTALQTYTYNLEATTAKTKQFNADILTLIQRGDVNLAAQLQAGGVDSSGDAARRAVANAKGAKAAEKAAGQAAGAQVDENLTKALQLVTILGQHKGDVGVTGLANASGMSVGDVWELLTHYDGKVFSKLRGSGKMTTVNLDKALAAKGEQLTGLATGAIIPASRTGLHIRWAEPSSGGESYIPHGGNMARNRALWAETGRIIGARAGTTIAPGAVSVSLAFSGSNLTAAEVQRIADNTASKALDGLVSRINAG